MANTLYKENDDSFLNDLDFQDLYKIVNVDLDLLPYSLPKGYSLKSEKNNRFPNRCE